MSGMVIDPATELCSKKYYQARDGFCLRKQKSQALKSSSLNLCQVAHVGRAYPSFHGKTRLLPHTPPPCFAQEHNNLSTHSPVHSAFGHCLSPGT